MTMLAVCLEILAGLAMYGGYRLEQSGLYLVALMCGGMGVALWYLSGFLTAAGL